jgi:hypothetical protein
LFQSHFPNPLLQFHIPNPLPTVLFP